MPFVFSMMGKGWEGEVKMTIEMRIYVYERVE